ncbi:hypothetical protein ACYULU_14660 [Breznakiellaceae bacterium SP9]
MARTRGLVDERGIRAGVTAFRDAWVWFYHRKKGRGYFDINNPDHGPIIDDLWAD